MSQIRAGGFKGGKLELCTYAFFSSMWARRGSTLLRATSSHLVLWMDRGCLRRFSLSLETRVTIPYVSGCDHTCFHRLVCSYPLVVLDFVVATVVQIILSYQSQICVTFKCRHGSLTSCLRNSTRLTLFVYVEGRVHRLGIVIILLVGNVLVASPLLVNHKTIIGQIGLVKLVTVLQVFYLCREVNFTLEKLLSDDLLLVLFSLYGICVLYCLTLVSAIHILRTFVEHLLIVKIVSAWLYNRSFDWVGCVYVPTFGHFLLSVLLKVVIWDVTSLLVFPGSRVSSQCWLCKDHLWVLWLFSAWSRRFGSRVVGKIFAGVMAYWWDALFTIFRSSFVKDWELWRLIRLLSLHNSFFVLENWNTRLHLVIILLLSAFPLVVFGKRLAQWLNGDELWSISLKWLLTFMLIVQRVVEIVYVLHSKI